MWTYINGYVGLLRLTQPTQLIEGGPSKIIISMLRDVPYGITRNVTILNIVLFESYKQSEIEKIYPEMEIKNKYISESSEDIELLPEIDLEEEFEDIELEIIEPEIEFEEELDDISYSQDIQVNVPSKTLDSEMETDSQEDDQTTDEEMDIINAESEPAGKDKNFLVKHWKWLLCGLIILVLLTLFITIAKKGVKFSADV